MRDERKKHHPDCGSFYQLKCDCFLAGANPKASAEDERTWWIDPNTDLEDEDCEPLHNAFAKHPGQGPLQWQASLIKVVPAAEVERLKDSITVHMAARKTEVAEARKEERERCADILRSTILFMLTHGLAKHAAKTLENALDAIRNPAEKDSK